MKILNLFRAVSYLVFPCMITSLAHAETYSIRADEWFPINGTPNSEKPGYMIEIAEAILKKNGHQLDYKTMPWERSLDQVRKGNFDCVVGAYIDDAPDFVFPALPWGMIETNFYTIKDSDWRYQGLESLASISLGSIGGYAYSEELDAYIEEFKSTSKVQVINANNALEQNIKKLLAKRIDALVESDLVMSAKLRDMNLLNDIKSSGQLAEATNMYIACSPAKPGSQKLVDAFNTGLTELRQSGELARILEKYGLKDWHTASE